MRLIQNQQTTINRQQSTDNNQDNEKTKRKSMHDSIIHGSTTLID